MRALEKLQAKVYLTSSCPRANAGGSDKATEPRVTAGGSDKATEPRANAGGSDKATEPPATAGGSDKTTGHALTQVVLTSYRATR
jgi:hypothetical protein